MAQKRTRLIDRSEFLLHFNFSFDNNVFVESMADQQSLKDIPYAIQSGKLAVRKKVFEYLADFVKKNATPQTFKSICRLLHITLPRYGDSKSTRLVDNYVRSLVKCHPESVPYLIKTIHDVAETYKNVHPTKAIAHICYATFSWSCHVANEVFKEAESNDQDIQTLINSQALLLYSINGAQSKFFDRKAYACAVNLWRQPDGRVIGAYLSRLKVIPENQSSLVLLGYFVRYLVESKSKDALQEIKEPTLQIFSKVIIGSKTKPLLHVVISCNALLRQITHDEFKSIILSTVQKALLRNPEIIFETACKIMSSLSLDLSQYALDIGKSVGVHLHSKEDQCRDDAVVASKCLAQQCSSSEAVRELIEHYFGILNGSEGKLTVVTQKIGVLSGIGNLSFNIVSGSSSVQTICEFAVNNFVAFLKHEVHDGTIVHAIQMLSLWCSKLPLVVPQNLIVQFQDTLTQKNSTFLQRNAYISCMNSSFHGNTLHQATNLVPVLEKAFVKAIVQTTQINALMESLSLFCLFLKMCSIESEAETKIRSIINTDISKLQFFSEKFILCCSDEALLSLAYVIEKLFLDHNREIDENSGILKKCLLYILTRPTFKVRMQAISHLKKMLSSSGGLQLALCLLKDFPSVVSTLKIKNVSNMEESESQADEISVHVLQDVLLSICNAPNLQEEDVTKICLQSLIPCHLEKLHCTFPKLWETVVAKLQGSIQGFVELHSDEILSLLLKTDEITADIMQAKHNALKTIVQIPVCDEIIVCDLVAHCIEVLSKPAFSNITREEFRIFLTPKDQLYDMSVVENLKEQTNQNKNIKRESKLYTYKEQMEEIEFKKEIEAKKRAKGLISKEPELTKKQQEAKKIQLDKESAIRAKVEELNAQLDFTLSNLQMVINANPKALGIHIKDLTTVLISLFSSPLCAHRATRMFVSLSEVVAAGILKTWGKPIAYITMRLLTTACDLEPSWVEINADEISFKIIKFLYINTCQVSETAYDEYALSKITRNHLSSPGFSYCFPLIQHLLLAQIMNVELVEQMLYIISEHSDIRVEDESIGQSYQEGVPTLDMLQVLVQVISQTSGQIQALAIETLLKVSQAASGDIHCSFASMKEIDVLLNALLIVDNKTRFSALQGLKILESVLPSLDNDRENAIRVLRRVFVSRFDPVGKNKTIADELYEMMSFSKDPVLCDLILEDVINPQALIRQEAAEALASLVSEFSDNIPPTIQTLLKMYQDKLYIPPPTLDSLFHVIKESHPDNWEARSGIAMAFGKLSPYLNVQQVIDLMSFFVPDALGDRNPTVRKNMLDAAIAIINVHGENVLSEMLLIFKDFLDDDKTKEGSFDAVRQSVVILMGTLARHLDKDDPRVKPIITKLIETLSTPSQQVQDAVANCLPPLVPTIKDDCPVLVRTLLELLLKSDNYGERKGAAYGLAGFVKGLGILVLNQLDIMNTLLNAIQDKKNYKKKEGALMAFEMLCYMLGKVFEPYIVTFLPHLLNCFGDSNQYVREATVNTAQAVMSQLSGHGVKLVLPSLLAALEQDSWRTKAGSIELLGHMSNCAPKQLSACLPSIVPKLIDVLTDSHHNVQKAGAQALKQIGSVIRNPEIQAIVPNLLDALQDPSKKTSSCLVTLLNTRFVHFIDSPSLALIMPVVQRAFQDRSTETRKMAAQIIGNMYSLTDQKDLAPYLPSIIPGLKQSLLDPVPEVRSVSARALGAMVKGMGHSIFEDLLPWLMTTLISETSSVDRSGAAQGLSEVIGGLGIEKLKELMPGIISTSETMDSASHVKDGYIMMFIYLPMVFKRDFTPYIGQIINPILKALADENEYVRDTALRAGQRIVNMYADTAITLLLPELERGLFDDNWRIRYSSVQLLGDLLYKISGVTGKMTTETIDEDDNFGTEQSQKAILGSLGMDRRNRVLAGLYMGRSDVALMVRQAALHVWKVVVTNTPRTLREILPTLFSLLLGCLASNSYDKRRVAARTLGDLVRKLGERVLPEIIPILEKGLESNRPDQRQGVCIGLSEIMASTSRDMVLMFVDSLVPTVRRALSDPLPEVRNAAALTFDSLHSTVGVRALDDILPSLLRQLGDPAQSDYALDGLRQVMSIKSKVVLPYLVPQLTAPPVNTKALSYLSTVAGDALTKHLPKLLPALLFALSNVIDTPTEAQVLKHCQTVVLAVVDDLGVRTVVDHLLEATRSEDPLRRHAAAALLCSYCCQKKEALSHHAPQLIRGFIRLFMDSEKRVVQLSWEALLAVTKNLVDVETYVPDVRQAVRFASSDLKPGELMPGLCLPRGLDPILPIFRDAILKGSPEQKENAAQGLGEVIKLASSDALKSAVVPMTGPLIRILGDRYHWSTKVAFLDTLSLLLEKIGNQMKAFLPQVQTTFLKSLVDGHRNVRLKAANSMRHLIVIHHKPDTFYAELQLVLKNAEDSSFKESTIHAMRCCIQPAGQKMSDAVRRSIMTPLMSYLGYTEDSLRIVAAACIGSMTKFLPQDDFEDIARDHLLEDDTSLDWVLRHAKCIILMVTLKEAPERLLTNTWCDRIPKVLLAYLTADRHAVVLTGVRASGYFMLYMMQQEKEIPQTLLAAFAKSMNHPTNEVKQVVALAVNFLARNLTLPQYFIKAVVPHLVNGTKEKNTIVKSNSEFALVTLLHLRSDDSTAQAALNAMDSGAREALQDVIAKVLKKVSSQPEPKEEDLDDTLLT